MSPVAPRHVVVYVTCGSQQEASRIAHDLVEQGLIACANLVPGITSVYRWQGTVHNDPEVLLIAKTRRDLFAALSRRVKELHSYDLPEIIALPLEAGLPGYLQWIDDACRAPESPSSP